MTAKNDTGSPIAANPIYYIDNEPGALIEKKRYPNVFADYIKHVVRHVLRGEGKFQYWDPCFPILSIPPDTIDGVLIKCPNKDAFFDGCKLYINGILTTLKTLGSHNGFFWYLLAAKQFVQWENVFSSRWNCFPSSISIHPAWFSLEDVAVGAGSDAKLRVWPSEKLQEISGTSLVSPKSDELSEKTGVSAAADFIYRSCNHDSYSPFDGLCYGCYDLTNRGYRLSSWVWTNGIVVSALLEQGHPKYTSMAKKIGEKLLHFQLKNNEHRGAFRVRNDPVNDNPTGITTWLAPNDSSILAAYGLLPLYEFTREPEYMTAAVSVADWIMHEGFKQGNLRVGFRSELGMWVDNWLYLDAGFTPVLFSKLYRLNRRPEWQQACKDIMENLISRLYAGNGRYYASWIWPGRHGKNLFSRGHGWILDGLIETFHCTGESRFLRIAMECARFVMGFQNESGGWYYHMNRPQTGECNKGTSVLAYHLLRLYSISKEHRFKDAALQALDWCRKKQYKGPDTHALGGIVSWNTEGAIGTAENVTTAFPYASAFQILAEAESEALK
jgi:rhamnogalacturonyl hydrolase YesR